jgi:ribosome-associated heat shock protein Hsp15
MDKMRIDKWLWAARFYKTRSLASDELQKGRVQVNDQEAKPAREIKVGDTVSLRQAAGVRTVVVQVLSQQRGPAPVAQQLYAETPESVLRRETAQAQRKLAREPALSIEQGRPTKRQRRDLDQARHGWDNRWSASIDNP